MSGDVPRKLYTALKFQIKGAYVLKASWLHPSCISNSFKASYYWFNSNFPHYLRALVSFHMYLSFVLSPELVWVLLFFFFKFFLFLCNQVFGSYFSSIVSWWSHFRTAAEMMVTSSLSQEYQQWPYFPVCACLSRCVLLIALHSQKRLYLDEKLCGCLLLEMYLNMPIAVLLWNFNQ